jgi:hypothetical protein
MCSERVDFFIKFGELTVAFVPLYFLFVVLDLLFLRSLIPSLLSPFAVIPVFFLLERLAGRDARCYVSRCEYFPEYAVSCSCLLFIVFFVSAPFVLVGAEQWFWSWAWTVLGEIVLLLFVAAACALRHPN